jgi:hypothetical protein
MRVSRKCSIPVTIAAAALVLTACGESIDDEDVSMSFNCNEARGALFRLDQMLTGQAPIQPSQFGGGTLLRLAEEKKAPETIMRDLETWRGALLAHSHSLTSFQPQIENGRFVEPDTSVIDRTLIETVRPTAERLDAWVAQECGRL